MVCRRPSPKEITEAHAARHESGGANIAPVDGLRSNTMEEGL
jgi:hypothetical protein